MKNWKKLLTIVIISVMLVSALAIAACTPNDDGHTHTLVKTDAKAATCDVDGNVAYWTCSDCGKIFSDDKGATETTLEQVTVPAGHTLTKTDAKGSTCAEAGNTTYWHCSVCDKYFSDENGATETTLDNVTVAAGHTLVKNEANDATCEEDGNVEYWHCSVCGKDFADEDATEELDDVTLPAHHELVKHEETPEWNKTGYAEHWDCSECGKVFADENGDEEISHADVEIAPVALPDMSEDEDVFVGNAKANQSFWTAANWITFTASDDTYENGTEKPTYVDGDESYLLFTKAARFELFHVPGVGGSFVHLGENSQGGNSQWGNTGNFSGLYDNTFIYTFTVSANGAFAWEVFGLGGGKMDRTGQGTSLLFDGNLISFYAVGSNGGNNQSLRAIATLPEGFDFGDGQQHKITLSIKRSAPVGGTSVTDYAIYVDGYMVRFVNQVTSTWNVADENGVLKISIGNSGMGQRFSVIPQINSAEGEDTTYSEVRIYDLEIKRHYPETTETETIAMIPEFILDEKYAY